MAGKMTGFMVAGLMVFTLATPAITQENVAPAAGGDAAQAPANLAIEDVIANQLDAFKDRDLDQAWDYASPMIQGIFGSVSNFGQMVSEGYPMVWDNSDVRFLQREQAGDGQNQTVMIQDALGALHMLQYRMIEADDGWRIDGVTMLPAPDVGV